MIPKKRRLEGTIAMTRGYRRKKAAKPGKEIERAEKDTQPLFSHQQ